MSFKRSNKMTVSQQQDMNELFSIIEQSNDSDLQHEANMYKLRQTFGRDSMESEQSQFNSSEESQNAAYAARKIEMRNVGSNGRSTGPNLQQLNSTPLSDRNAELSRDYSGFAKPNYLR